MDSAITGTRKYPGMTTDELKCSVMDLQMGLNPNAKYMTADEIANKIADMTAEAVRRQNGTSKTAHQLYPCLGR